MDPIYTTMIFLDLQWPDVFLFDCDDRNAAMHVASEMLCTALHQKFTVFSFSFEGRIRGTAFFGAKKHPIVDDVSLINGY